jgi:hypothetical protein
MALSGKYGKLDIPTIGSDEEERAGMRIAGEGEPSGDPEEIEACPVETIIRIWRHLQHGLQGRSSQDSFLAARPNVDKKIRRRYTNEKTRGIFTNSRLEKGKACADHRLSCVGEERRDV